MTAAGASWSRAVRRRSAGAALVLLLGGPALSACTSSLTADRVQRSVDAGFTSLYLHQQALLGHPRRTPDWVAARSTCLRRNDESPAAGAGDDWQCVVTWRSVDGTSLDVVLEVDVKANGCLTATSPPGTLGAPVLPAAGDRAPTNPLYQFDLCLPAPQEPTG